MSSLTVILLVALGYLLKKLGVVQNEFADSMIKLVFYVFLPATLFYSMIQLKLESSLLLLPLAGFFVALCCYSFAYSVRKFFKMKRRTEGSFIIASGAMNQGLFIYPFFLIYEGTKGLSYAAFYDVGQAFLALTLGYFIAVSYGRGHAKANEILKNVLGFPTLWAFALALLVNYLGFLPSIKAVMPLVEMLHNCTTPLIMLSLGVFVELKITKLKAMFGVLFTRFVFSLGVAALLIYLLHLTGLEKTTVLIASAAPPAMLTLVYSVEEKLDSEYTAKLLSIAIFIGLLYIPLLFALT